VDYIEMTLESDVDLASLLHPQQFNGVNRLLLQHYKVMLFQRHFWNLS